MFLCFLLLKKNLRLMMPTSTNDEQLDSSNKKLEVGYTKIFLFWENLQFVSIDSSS